MKRALSITLCLILILLMVSGCRGTGEGLNNKQKDATDATTKINKEVYQTLDFNDKSEFDSATAGLIEAPDDLQLYDGEGKVIFNRQAYSFITENTPSPDTVNPSLWSNAQLNNYYGLFEVRSGVFQVRGYDITNMTLIQSENGWIVIDPMSNVECARAAMQLIEKNTGKRDIQAVIYTSADSNCYGGVKGVISEFEVSQRNIPIIAPAGFVEKITSAGLYTENSTARISEYLNGSNLEKSEKGTLGVGYGISDSNGSISYIPPNTYIEDTSGELSIDGINMSFQLSSKDCANLTMNVYFKDLHTLWMSENISGTLQGFSNLTGGEITDGNAFSAFLKKTLASYGKDVQAVIQAHNWPHLGKESIRDYIINTATTYKYIHDQTANKMEQGKSPDEISRELTLPDKLNKCWYLRQYVTPLSQSVRATYSKLRGVYNANPVLLNPLNDDQAAKKFVQYMGGTDEILRRAVDDYNGGQYQWVAQITNTLLSVEPKNEKARFLCADSLEQLGYQSESAVYRNAYLTAAKELREGVDLKRVKEQTSYMAIRDSMTTEQILDLLGSMIKADSAQGMDLTINANIVDRNEQYVLTLKNCVLMYYKGVLAPKPSATLTMNKEALFALADKDLSQAKNIITVDGDTTVLDQFDSVLARYNSSYEIMG